MFLEKSVIVLCTVFVFSDAAFVDTLSKCGKDDGECHKNLFQYFLKEASKSGVPELNIPVFDPVVLKDINVPILDVADLHMDDGVVKGLRKCVVNKFSTNVEAGHSSVDLTCDLTVKGHYKAFSDSPLIKSILGADSLRGDGNAKVKIEKLNLKINFNFGVEQRNGDTYFKEKSKPTYKFNILGKVQFAADKLFIGDEDASARVTGLLNQSWKVVVGTVGNQFMERAMERIREYLRNFFDNVPTKNFISDDLTPYVK